MMCESEYKVSYLHVFLVSSRTTCECEYTISNLRAVRMLDEGEYIVSDLLLSYTARVRVCLISLCVNGNTPHQTYMFLCF